MGRDANEKKIIIGGITYSLNEKEKTATVISVNEEAISEDGELTFPNEITSEGNENYLVTKIRGQIIDVNINRFSLENNLENDFPKNIKKVVIPENITDIQQMAFKELTSIEEVEFQGESKLKYIGANAFVGCSSLIDITIPESVTIINVDAFRGCSKLVSLTFPKDSTVIISERSFEKCENLEELHFLGKAQAFKEDIEDKKFDHNMNSLGATDITEMSKEIYFYMSNNGKNHLSSITIPKGVTSIGARTFYYCRELKEIKIPEGVTSIGECAFEGCFELKEIKIPEGVTSIERHTFAFCINLAKVEIPIGVTSIETRAFSRCIELTEIKIPEGVTSIGEFAFEGCEKLKKLKIPEALGLIEYIGLSLNEIIYYDPSAEIEEETGKIDEYRINTEDIRSATKGVSPEITEEAKSQVNKDINEQELTKDDLLD